MGEVHLMPSGGSIQGRQQALRDSTLWADLATVLQYVEHADEGDLVCKDRVRHGYKRAKRGEPLKFVSKTKSGNYVRRQLCPDCKKVQLVEVYKLIPKRGTKNIIADVQLVTSYSIVIDDSYKGEPGNGRMKPTMLRQAIHIKAMAGMDIREIEKEIAEIEAERIQGLVAP